MKILFVTLFVAVLSVSLACGQTPAPNEENIGTITEFAPGSRLVLKTDAGDTVAYTFAKQLVIQNANGREIPISKLKRDRKVRVHYLKTGTDLAVDKVTLVQE